MEVNAVPSECRRVRQAGSPKQARTTTVGFDHKGCLRPQRSASTTKVSFDHKGRLQPQRSDQCWGRDHSLLVSLCLASKQQCNHTIKQWQQTVNTCPENVNNRNIHASTCKQAPARKTQTRPTQASTPGNKLNKHVSM